MLVEILFVTLGDGRKFLAFVAFEAQTPPDFNVKSYKNGKQAARIFELPVMNAIIKLLQY